MLKQFARPMELINLLIINGCKKNEECECCHKQGARYKVVRWVKPGEWSFVAGVNIAPAYYCSMDCMEAEEKADKYVRVKMNTISEINALGYPA